MLHSVKRQTQRPQIRHEHMETAALRRDESDDEQAAPFSAVWREQLKTLWDAAGPSQSLLKLTHDSVCSVPCLADGPEISTDQEGAVPPHPSSASAFPLPGLSLSARHHHPSIRFPHSDEFLAFS